MFPKHASNVLFGITGLDIESCRELLEDLLGVAFVGHESSYWGEYYLAKTSDGESFKLIPNLDAEEDLVEPEFSSIPLLFYAYRTLRPQEISEAIDRVPGLVELRKRSVVDSGLE